MTKENRYQTMLILFKMNDKTSRTILRSINKSHIPIRIIKRIADTIDGAPTEQDGERLHAEYIKYDRERFKAFNERRKKEQHRNDKNEGLQEGDLTAIIPAESACFLINGEPCRFIGFDTYEGTTTAAMASIGRGRIFAVDIVTLHNHKPMRAEEFKTSKQ